jgi:hypothetical protein
MALRSPFNKTIILQLYSNRLIKYLIRSIFIVFIIAVIVLTYRTKRYTVPYFYIGLELFLILVLGIIRSKKSPYLRSCFITLAMITFTFAFCEAYLAGWFSAKVDAKGIHMYRFEGTYVTNSKNYWKYDKILGYAGGKNISVTATKYYQDKVVYDITYTDNRYGLRITPHDIMTFPGASHNPYDNVVFFGCSFMVGQGVNDNETLPYQFEELSGESFRAYNYGFHGYGPHQMLRILETGLIDETISDKKISIAICEILTNHVERSAGKYPYIIWDVNGPKYVLNHNGEPEYVGRFGDNIRFQIVHILNSIFAKSYLLEQTNIRTDLFYKKREPKDISLFISIIKKSKELFEQKYNGHFIVLLWKLPGDEDYATILSKLQESHIDVVTTDEIFQGENLAEKYLIKNDDHPNKLANRKLAEFLLAKIRSAQKYTASQK